MFAKMIVNPDGVREEAEYTDDPATAHTALQGLSDSDIREAIDEAGCAYEDQLAQLHDIIQAEALALLVNRAEEKEGR